MKVNSLPWGLMEKKWPCGSYQLQSNFCQCSVTASANMQCNAISSPETRTSRWGWEWEMGLPNGVTYAWDNHRVFFDSQPAF